MGLGGISKFVLINGINPEPWTSPTASVGRKGGRVYARMVKDRGLAVYQEAIREAIEPALEQAEPTDEPITLVFYLWRQRTRYVTKSGRMAQKNAADATNMQKALEDALQGLLFANDRQVQAITTHVMEQGPEVEPKILIHLSAHAEPPAWIDPIVEYGTSIAINDVAIWDDLTLEG